MFDLGTRIGILFLLFNATLGLCTNDSTSQALPKKYEYEIAPPSKQVIGTAYEESGSASPLWFTLTGGMITELFYPTVNQPQLGELQFIVTDGKDFFSEQRKDTISQVFYEDEGLTIRVTGKDRSRSYTYTQEIFSDSASPVLRIRTHFQWLTAGLRVFVIYKPTIHGKSEGNLGEANTEALVASAITSRGQEPIFSTLIASKPWRQISVENESDFLNFYLNSSSHSKAGPGSILLIGELPKDEETSTTFELALGFGPSLSAALTYTHSAMTVPFEQGAEIYANGWKNYLHKLNSGPQKPRFIQDSLFARRSAQLIKMHEDKRHRGAIVSSLSAPSSESSTFSISSFNRLISPIRVRDTYRGAMGLLAAGDTITPVDTLHYLMNSQREDGSWRPLSLEKESRQFKVAMDEIALPILLAYHLHHQGLIQLKTNELEMVRKSASFILSHGPVTELDRWDSASGFIPSTLAIEIAALRAATVLTKDTAPSNIADLWQSQIEKWTLIQQGPLGTNYYLQTRSPTLHSVTTPPASTPHTDPSTLAISIGPIPAESLVDGGFLDLVRYGIREPNDSRILNTLQLYDNPSLGISTGLHYHRHTLDTQGPGQKQGAWPVLSGERGMYAIAARDFERARSQLHALENSATENGLIPAQTQAGLEVPCPLMWAHAEDILLHRSIEEGIVFDQPNSHLPH